MLVKKAVEVPATLKEKVDYYQCDLCGKKSDEDGHWVSSTERSLSVWRAGVCHNLHEVGIEMRIGDTYPEGSWGETTRFDICTDCFRDKLMPWFESQGAKPRREEWDY
jgi:hypothetical protein